MIQNSSNATFEVIHGIFWAECFCWDRNMNNHILYCRMLWNRTIDFSSQNTTDPFDLTARTGEKLKDLR